MTGIATGFNLTCERESFSPASQRRNLIEPAYSAAIQPLIVGTINLHANSHKLSTTLLLLGSVFASASASFAQTAEMSEEELAKKAQNPISSMVSLPLQNNTDFDFGPEEGTLNTLNVQPVWPFAISDDWNLVTRTILPIVSQPGLAPGQGRENGLGDINFTGFFSPKEAGKWIWGVGPTVILPTSTDDRLGKGEWGAGVSMVVLTMPGNWVVGSLFSNVWDVSASTGNEINFFTWQYFINYNLPNGWYLTSSPVITADWEADSKQRWTVPFGGGVGKIFRVGKQALNAQVHAYYNVEKPDIKGDWGMRLQLQFMFPR
jgi:hypothetical protein